MTKFINRNAPLFCATAAVFMTVVMMLASVSPALVA
jgi:hypothetical protein